jgi:hypothetical protein
MAFPLNIYINILMHITFLFFLFSIIFTNIITKISTYKINNHINNYINDSFKPSKINLDSIKQKYNYLKKLLDNTQDENQRFIINNQMENIKFLLIKTDDSDLPSFPLKDIKNILANLEGNSFDYYLNLFKNENRTRKLLNKALLLKIKMINVILILFLISVIYVMTKQNYISQFEIKTLFLNNFYTYILLGIIQILFFNYVVYKYQCETPSFIINTLINTMKQKLV